MATERGPSWELGKGQTEWFLREEVEGLIKSAVLWGTSSRPEPIRKGRDLARTRRNQKTRTAPAGSSATVEKPGNS